jgi:Amt family ammonium transporter
MVDIASTLHDLDPDPRDHGPGVPTPDLFVALLDDATDLAAVVSEHGELRYLNRAGRRMLALRPDHEVRTVRLADLLASAESARMSAEVRPALTADGTWSGTLVLVTPHGSEVLTRCTMRLHETPAGDVTTLVARDISTDRAVVEHIANKAFYDRVTGLNHKSLFLDRLDLSLRKLRDGAGPVAVLFVSLDRFKEKNDRFGNDVGDELLRGVARRLTAIIGDRDTVARWGGDEFVVLREDITGDDDAVALATRVLSSFEEPLRAGSDRIYLSASLGVATAEPGELSIDEMLRRADTAAQMAKQRGGAALHLFDADMRARALRRAEIEDALHGAAARGELVLHYQPEVLLRTNEIVGVEALLRWQHPEWGWVAPNEFIPVAETSALILEVGNWVLREAMEQAALWRTEFPDRQLGVAINLSSKQYVQDDIVETIAGMLERSGAEPGDICLEITEGVLMDDLDETVGTLRRLKALGVRLAVDDFGTGYSSLSYLRRFPVDILKVDQSFVSGLGHDPEDSAIVQAVVHMGQALGLQTVAEGVETGHHVIELRELACDVAQGYHFARPVAPETITRLLAAGRDWMSVAT